MATTTPYTRTRHEPVMLKPARKILLVAVLPGIVGVLALMLTHVGWFALVMLLGPIFGLYQHHVHRFPLRKHS